MRKSIDILLKALNSKHITTHVMCPSACSLLKELQCGIPDSIEIIDERSAGYVATGLCEEIESPVVIWCVNNDSFRNLTSALTEAYYRKLPLLIVALLTDFDINQAVNPYDIIRYYVGRYKSEDLGTDDNIKAAIDYLYSEVKGPVYLPIGAYCNAIVPLGKSNQFGEKYYDCSVISNLLPADACVHIGSDIICKCKHVNEVVFRLDHCTKDGNLSMFIGSSIISENQLHVGIFSYEEIVYDLNMLGNRHVGNNIIVICLVRQNKPSSIYSFAERMKWECKQTSILDLCCLSETFFIGNTPKYIEIVL